MRMSARAGWSAFWICGVFFGAAAIHAGCGSDSFTADTSTDGGSGDGDSARADAAADTGPGPCISAPTTVPPNEAAFCNAFAAISSRCNACQDCQKENAASCATFGDQLSDAFKAAIVACASEIDCADFEAQAPLAQDPCVSAYVFDAGPTSAQIAAKDAYCMGCSDAGSGSANCAGYFGSPDAGGIGSIVFFSSDSVATAVATQCGSCDGLTYPICEGLKLCAGIPKDQCGKGLCK